MLPLTTAARPVEGIRAPSRSDRPPLTRKSLSSSRSYDRHLAYEGVDCHDGGNQVLASPAIERLPTTKFQPEPEIPPICGGGVGTKLRRTARARWSDHEAARWLGLRWVPLSPPSHFPGWSRVCCGSLSDSCKPPPFNGVNKPLNLPLPPSPGEPLQPAAAAGRAGSGRRVPLGYQRSGPRSGRR